MEHYNPGFSEKQVKIGLDFSFLRITLFQNDIRTEPE